MRAAIALMNAIVYREYGASDRLRCEELPKPDPGEGDVRIEVHAASVNPLDWHFLRGSPRMLRLASGLRRPSDPRIGVDVAGVVEATGPRVTQFAPGDAVFGTCRGAFAEFACAAATSVVKKPAAVTFEQAAAAPVAACTALQGLRDQGRLEAGQHVLINGAAGGVGTFAVQLARWLGATVTGVCSSRNGELVSSLGAHHVIDYTREDFTRGGVRYDVILDCIGNHSLAACRRVLQPNGAYVIIGGPDGRWFGPLGRGLAALLWSSVLRQRLRMFVANANARDLTLIGELMAAGRVTPVIERRYPLLEVPDAIAHVEGGHARGKVVIAVRPRNGPAPDGRSSRHARPGAS